MPCQKPAQANSQITLSSPPGGESIRSFSRQLRRWNRRTNVSRIMEDMLHIQSRDRSGLTISPLSRFPSPDTCVDNDGPLDRLPRGPAAEPSLKGAAATRQTSDSSERFVGLETAFAASQS